MSLEGITTPNGQVINGLWSLRATEGLTVTVEADGCADLIVERAAAHTRAWVTPATGSAFAATVAPHTQVFGVRVRVGLAGALHAHGVQLIEAALHSLSDGAGAEAIVAATEHTLEESAALPAVLDDFLHAATESAGRYRLSSSSLSTRRALQRAAKSHLQLSPKRLLRILRAHAAKRAVLAGERLADVAGDTGFSDQAHLTREFRELLGRTPQQLLVVANLQDERAPKGNGDANKPGAAL